MVFTIKYKHIQLKYKVDFKNLDVIDLVDFKTFVQVLFNSAPSLFMTDFKTMYQDELIKFETVNEHEVFTISSGE